MSGMEDAKWNPRVRGTQGGKPSQCVELLRTVRPGEIKRIVHDDVQCLFSQNGTCHCTLYQEVKRLRRCGWKIHQYHEADHLMVVKRLK